MRIFGLMVLLFILVSFSLGVSLTESENLTPLNITDALDRTNLTQIELSRVDTPNENFVNVNNFLNIIESYVRFFLTLSVEVLKAGVNFGYDNPDYFEPVFILKIVKWIVILVIISLLIKPVTYGIVLLILFGIWIKDKIKKKRKNEKKTKA